MAGAWFGRKPAVDRADNARVRALATSAWAQSCAGHGDTQFSVSEIVCRDPSCPGTETIILVMEPGKKTRALKIARAIVDVTEADVRAALAQPGI